MEPPDRTTGISAPPASLLSGLSAGTLGFEALLQDAVSHASQLHTLHQTASEAAPPPPACTRPVYPTWQQAPPPPAMPSARLLPPMAGASPPAEEATEAASESKGKQKGKGKGKAKGQAKEQTKRVKWSNKMVGELLRLRFSDGDVKQRLEAADTKTKKALAWQYFASVLSQSLGMVLNHDHVSLKYRKLKCIYRKEKRELKKTGNSARISETDEALWTILNDAFGGRVGISGEVILDSALDEDEGKDEESPTASAKEDIPSNQKAPPVAQLATALQGGMEAIAASLGTCSSSEDQLRALTTALREQHEETRRFQEVQLQLLRDLLTQHNG